MAPVRRTINLPGSDQSARPRLLAFLSLALLGLAAGAAPLPAEQQPPSPGSAERRAVSYLAAEVPRWRREHPCYSCHNNGDAVRALITADRAGFSIGTAADETFAWLRAPGRWVENARRGGSEELPLGRIQFAGALISLADAGRASQDAVDQAAALVAGHQEPDGSWRPNTSQLLGGATSYGTVLATASARRVLDRAGSPEARAARDRDDDWLSALRVDAVLDASSLLLGLGSDKPSGAEARERALALLRQGQGPDGGWGAYVSSPSEPFDTALAVLALSRVGPDASGPFAPAELRAAIDRGRQYLVASQVDEGSWVETTRPPGQESYAQRISTTAWALLALIETATATPRGTGW